MVGVGQEARETWLKPVESFRDLNLAPEMVVIPAGSFTMGELPMKRGDKLEGPKRKVTIAKPFALEYAVTFDEWDAYAADGGSGILGFGKRYVPSDQGWGRERRPVINVSWNDANAYLAWLKTKTGKEYRLLSEAEWEYVCRAGSSGPFWWGSRYPRSRKLRRKNQWRGIKGKWREKTVSVDSFEPNPWGLYQVHGNVWEWVEDCLHDYEGASSDDSKPREPRWQFSQRRGGSWDAIPRLLRAAYRGSDSPVVRHNDVGFRVARTLEP